VNIKLIPLTYFLGEISRLGCSYTSKYVMQKEIMGYIKSCIIYYW